MSWLTDTIGKVRELDTERFVLIVFLELVLRVLIYHLHECISFEAGELIGLSS